MKTIIAATAASLLTAGVSASNIYHDMGTSNPDLSHWTPRSQAVTGIQPSVGERFDSYREFVHGNPTPSVPAGPIARSNGHSLDDQPIYVGPGRTL